MILTAACADDGADEADDIGTETGGEDGVSDGGQHAAESGHASDDDDGDGDFLGHATEAVTDAYGEGCELTVAGASAMDADGTLVAHAVDPNRAWSFDFDCAGEDAVVAYGQHPIDPDYPRILTSPAQLQESFGEAFPPMSDSPEVMAAYSDSGCWTDDEAAFFTYPPIAPGGLVRVHVHTADTSWVSEADADGVFGPSQVGPCD